MKLKKIKIAIVRVVEVSQPLDRWNILNMEGSFMYLLLLLRYIRVGTKEMKIDCKRFSVGMFGHSFVCVCMCGSGHSPYIIRSTPECTSEPDPLQANTQTHTHFGGALMRRV